MAARDEALAQEGQAALAEAFEKYKQEFPDVPDIAPAELNALQKSSETHAIVVDVRTPEEQQVSMLPGAVTQQDFKQHISGQDRSTPIVTYCTAGLRSGRFAADLQKLGFHDVRNLEGSLIAWAHAGLPLVDGDGRPVKKFHAYGPQWADMAKGSGYETVVHKQWLLKGAFDTIKSWWPFG